MAHGGDMVGRPCSEEEVAKGLGFVNVEAFRAWKIFHKMPKDQQLDAALSECCNLAEQVKILAGQVEDLYGRTLGDVLLD